MSVKIWHPKKSIILAKKIGDGSKIHAPTWIGRNVVLGKNVRVQAFAFICDGIILEDNVFVGPHVCFTNDLYPPSNGKHWKKTLVKSGAVIGANATILPGITIGEKAMVGAGSVVLCSIPDNEVWCGNPARKIR